MHWVNFVDRYHEKYNETVQFGLFISFVTVSIYILSIFITRGLVFASHPGYNSDTGCPSGMRTCNDDEKMICSNNHMRHCYTLSVLTTVVMMLLLSLVTGILVLIGRAFGWQKKETKEDTPNDEQELLEEN